MASLRKHSCLKTLTIKESVTPRRCVDLEEYYFVLSTSGLPTLPLRCTSFSSTVTRLHLFEQTASSSRTASKVPVRWQGGVRWERG